MLSKRGWHFSSHGLIKQRLWHTDALRKSDTIDNAAIQAAMQCVDYVMQLLAAYMLLTFRVFKKR